MSSSEARMIELIRQSRDPAAALKAAVDLMLQILSGQNEGANEKRA